MLIGCGCAFAPAVDGRSWPRLLTSSSRCGHQRRSSSQSTRTQTLSPEIKEFLNDFDIDGDGRFSFDEFLLFLVLLSVPLRDMAGIFTLIDEDDSASLDKAEFMGLVERLQALAGRGSPSAISRSKLDKSSGGCVIARPRSWRTTHGQKAVAASQRHRNEKSWQEGPKLPGGPCPLRPAPRRNEPLIEKWFGRDGKARVQLSQFSAFLVKLHAVFARLEFDLIDVDDDGIISGRDLARSLVAPASVSHVDRLLDRVRRALAGLRACCHAAMAFSHCTPPPTMWAS